MRILLMSAAGLAAMTALPVAAQSYPPDYSGGYRNSYSRVAVPRPWQVQSMIDAAERRGEISRDQASDLREQAQDLVRLDRRAQRDDDDGDARRNLNRRTFAVLGALREARSNNGNDDAYRERSSGYPPASRPAPQGDDDNSQPAPRYDDDQRYSPPPGSDDDYRAAPPSYDPGRTAPEYDDPNRATPPNYDPYRTAPPARAPSRAAPPPNDDRGYDDPNGQGDDDMPSPDDGIYQPRSN